VETESVVAMTIKSADLMSRSTSLCLNGVNAAMHPGTIQKVKIKAPEISFGICSNVSPICKIRAVCDSMPDSDKTKIALRPRIRVLHRGEIVMGPGKAELLTRIADTGSLSEAARRMKMSYMKAWLLVQVMNRSYRKPLVQAERGGTRGGRARLTSYGRRVLDCYREMEQRSLAAMQEPWKKVRRMLKNSPASR